MTIDKDTIIEQIRNAIDERKPANTLGDSFWSDMDEEIWQAVQMAVTQLSMELPRELLEPSALGTGMAGVALVSGSDGEGYIQILLDGDNKVPYLALYELKMNTWKKSVTQTFEPGGDEEEKQQNKWTRGTQWKPKVMEEKTYTTNGTLCTRLHYWSTGKVNGTYKHEIDRLLYIAQPTATTTGKLTTSLRKEATMYVIYRACRLVLTAKKELELAREFESVAPPQPSPLGRE